MKKHIVVCVDCGRQFDANWGAYYDATTRRYTCKRCHKLAVEAAKQMEIRRKNQKVYQDKETGLTSGQKSKAPARVSSKNYTVALLLAIFLGVLGIHRFYVGKTGTGVLWLLTAGFLGIGWLVDVVWLLGNCFEDWEDAPVVSEKGRARMIKDGVGAQHNAVPEVACWILIGVAVLMGVGGILIAMRTSIELPPLLWLLTYMGTICYPAALAWIISGKGLE